METLSRDTISELLSYLSRADLLNFCAINKTISSLCDENNKNFWRTKVLNDYKNVPNKPDNLSWKRFYILLGTTRQFIKRIPIIYDNHNVKTVLDKIWINNTDKPGKIFLLANQIFNSKYPNDCPIEFRMKDNNNRVCIGWANPRSFPQMFCSTFDFYNLIEQLEYKNGTSSFTPWPCKGISNDYLNYLINQF